MITVIYIPRSGSKFFSKKIAQEYNYDWLGELFNSRTYENLTEQNLLIESLENNPNVVFKIGAWESSAEKIKNYIDISDQTYLCVRLDFNQQLKSMYAATEPHIDNFHGEIQHADVIYDAVRFHELAEWLINQYQNTFKIVKDFPNVQTVVYESFATKQGKYARKFTWDTQPPHINFDINKIIKKINDLQT